MGHRYDRHPGKGDEEDEDPGMHDVAAVAAPVATDEPRQGERVRLAVLAMARARAAGELLPHRGCDEPGERDSHQGPAVAHAPDEQDQRSEEHTSELQSQSNLVCRLLLEKKKK